MNNSKSTPSFAFYATSMPNSRPADFYLGSIGGSVFIDFNKNKNGLIYLTRISFDGYGCCDIGETAQPLSKEESMKFIELVVRKEIDQDQLTPIILKTIEVNRKLLWIDALEEYEFIEKRNA